MHKKTEELNDAGSIIMDRLRQKWKNKDQVFKKEKNEDENTEDLVEEDIPKKKKKKLPNSQQRPKRSKRKT